MNSPLTLLLIITSVAVVSLAHAKETEFFPYKKNQPVAADVKPAALNDSAQHDAIMRGAAIARAADCTACHTADPQHPFAGGYRFDTGVGVMYSSNITSDPEQGIGNWTLADFKAALRDGESKDGHNLYPAMPFPSYQGMTDSDIADLWAYIRNLKADNYAPPENDMNWPFSWRWGLTPWKWVFFDNDGFTADDAHSKRWNRGAYLVNVLGHCGACHTERNFAMAKDQDQALQGAIAQGWYAPSLLSGPGQPLEDWTVEELTAFLQTGVTRDHFAAGPMREAVENSLQYLSASDRQAIAIYLKTLRKNEDGDTIALTTEPSTPAPAEASTAMADINQRVASFTIGEPILATATDRPDSVGEALYRDNCSACHLQGQGMPGMVPSLANNITITAAQPDNLLQVILHGARNAQTQQHPTVQVMPAFDWRLSDEEVAELATYLRKKLGNPENDAVTAEDVADHR